MKTTRYFIVKASPLWEKHHLRLSLIVVLFVLLSLASFVPYINLLFTPAVNLYIIFILFTQLFKLKESSIFKIIIAIFGVAGITQVLGFPEVAEQIGNWIYFAAFYGLILMMLSLRKRG